MRSYIVYDGRYMGDPDSAQVVTAFDAESDDDARRTFNREYFLTDFVLVEGTRIVEVIPKGIQGFGYN